MSLRLAINAGNGFCSAICLPLRTFGLSSPSPFLLEDPFLLQIH